MDPLGEFMEMYFIGEVSISSVVNYTLNGTPGKTQ